MPRLINQTPKYRRKTDGRAVVTLNGKEIYLGTHGTKVSKQEYDRVIGEWLANGRRATAPGGSADLTVVELVHAFWNHAKAYYHRPGGNNGELGSFKLALHHLKTLYGNTPAGAFGPLAMKVLRQAMIDADWSRAYVNRQVGRIKQVFKWAVGEQMVPADVYHALQCVPGLRTGRCEARESEPVKPVSEANVEAVRPHLSPQVRAMVDLQLLTGMRPGEVCQMRACDIDMTGVVLKDGRRLWAYRPAAHKTQHHGHDRVVYIGLRAQAVVQPFLRADLQAYLFSPREAEAWRRERMHAARKTSLSCGNVPGSNRVSRPGRKPGERYSVDAYRRAICYACERALAMPAALRPVESDSPTMARERTTKRAAWRAAHTWHPHQLRHNAATNLRREFGLEAAKVILGHKTLSVTEVYAEKDVAAAQRIMAEVG